MRANANSDIFSKAVNTPEIFHFIFFTKHELRHSILHSVKLRNNVKTKCRLNKTFKKN